MIKLLSFTGKFAQKAGDSEEVKFSKQLIFIVSASCCLCGLIWGAMYYLFLGPGLSMLIPWLFVVIVGCTIPVAHMLKNHYLLIYAQLICITWITAFLQWSLGSLHDASCVIAWSFLGPIGALLFLSKKQSIYWMAQFIAIVLITVLIEPHLSNDSENATNTSRAVFYVMNLCAPALVVFFASYYFVTDLIKQKKRSNQLNEELHNALDDLKKTQEQLIENEKLAAFGTAASRMAHEIQNPLNFVNNFSHIAQELVSELASTDTHENKKQDAIALLTDSLQKINYHGKRVSDIIAELQQHTIKGTAEQFFKKQDSFG